MHSFDLRVQYIISNKKCLYVKASIVRGFEFQLEIGQNAFLTSKLYFMCGASYELPFVQS
jgi:hypothetical protein